MNKSDFKKFCHDEFSKRNFIKRKASYYRQNDEGLLFEISLQGGYDYYYVNCYVYIGDYSTCAKYPKDLDFDLYCRPFCVISKDTIGGEHFVDAMIEYAEYTVEELAPCFEEAFEKVLLPAILGGKKALIANLEFWTMPLSGEKTKENILKALSN